MVVGFRNYRLISPWPRSELLGRLEFEIFPLAKSPYNYCRAITIKALGLRAEYICMGV